ncbi:DUF6160 family protein [Acinetobacter guerrae]|uniref:DUF6160 family protein n=1 Tax=Acinetobacter guerrae TaxID=1843371 RepID=UPI0021CC61D2|nr:DUF6160 family protein [Acinetobacter guerrae]
MNMISKSILGLCVMFSSHVWSGQLTELDDQSLQAINGQAGVDLNLQLSLNQTTNYNFDTNICTSAKLEYCRLAVSFNNRYDDGSQDTYNASGVRTPSATGKKQWLVFKGIQGTVLIDKLSLDGTDVTFKNKSGVDTPRASLMFGFDASKPIKIRNLGFQSLSIETDTAANEAGTPGYLNTDKYNASSDNTFDKNNPATGVAREKGFIGVNMNGNLALTGSIKLFSCADHARC